MIKSAYKPKIQTLDNKLEQNWTTVTVTVGVNQQRGPFWSVKSWNTELKQTIIW